MSDIEASKRTTFVPRPDGVCYAPGTVLDNSRLFPGATWQRHGAALALAALLAACGSSNTSVNPAPQALLSGKPEVIFHDNQPMVVDLQIKLRRPGSAVLELPGDPGARPAAPADEPGTDLTLRARGLMPDADYHGTLVLTGEDGSFESVDVDFHTLPPAPGFVASFPVTWAGTPSSEYRIFDLSVMPDMTEGAIIAAAPDGHTRFFLPRPAKTTVIPAVPAGIKLLPDGTLLFTQDNDALQVDELGNVLWKVSAASLGVAGFHHDIIEMPNGHYMAMSYVFKDVFLDADQKTHHVCGDLLVEFDRQGHKLWTWNSFDYLDAQRIHSGYEGFVTDPATGEDSNDWTHGNGILYQPEDDTVLLSMRHQDWVIKIDRKTGAILWRLGPDGDFKLTSGEWFWHQHSPQWQSDGSLLLYDNGVANPYVQPADARSRPIQIAFDDKTMTAHIVWSETNEKYLSIIAGDNDRLDNGNVSVLDSILPLPGGDFTGYSHLREVHQKDNQWVWTLKLPDNRFAYRCIVNSRLPGEAAE